MGEVRADVGAAVLGGTVEDPVGHARRVEPVVHERLAQGLAVAGVAPRVEVDLVTDGEKGAGGVTTQEEGAGVAAGVGFYQQWASPRRPLQVGDQLPSSASMTVAEAAQRNPVSSSSISAEASLKTAGSARAKGLVQAPALSS